MLTNLTEFMKSGADGPVGVAVSGGSDSTALLLLMCDWAKATGRDIRAVSVDHGLREGSADEVAQVASLCAQIGVSHFGLKWEGWNGKGNLQQEARRARQTLIARWANDNAVASVVTGHTSDDQAETFLMRLARGSGVDGLSAMYPIVRKEGIVWMRPLLDTRREALRDLLRSRNVGWVDDPSNEDKRFDRIKFRSEMDQLERLGLGPELLAKTATRIQSARGELERATLDFARLTSEPREIGTVRIGRNAFLERSFEMRMRLMSHTLAWVSGAEHPPRFASLKLALDAVAEGRTCTLSGCLIAPLKDESFEVNREVSAIKPVPADGSVYDKRWETSAFEGGEVRPLGEDGIACRPDWRDAAESRNAILSSPSIWYNNELMSAPFLDKNGRWTCRLIRGAEDFFSSIVTH